MGFDYNYRHSLLLYALIIVGGSYVAMALLFAYGINGFTSSDPAFVKSNSALIGLMWFVVAIVELFGYGFYAASFGFASERMVYYLVYDSLCSPLGPSGAIVIIPGNPATECCIF